MDKIIYYVHNIFYLQCLVVCAFMLIMLPLYRKLRISRWRKILKNSIEYHKFHLMNLNKDLSVNQASREFAQSLLWGITKQLPIDIKEGKGGQALINSFYSKKTSLNTCGSVFYECAKNYRSADLIIVKLNNTLLSTIYRIFIIESRLSLLGLLYCDITLLFYTLTKSEKGSGRFYIEMTGNSGSKKR